MDSFIGCVCDNVSGGMRQWFNESSLQPQLAPAVLLKCFKTTPPQRNKYSHLLDQMHSRNECLIVRQDSRPAEALIPAST